MRSFCAAVTAALTVASVDGKLFGALQSSLSYYLLPTTLEQCLSNLILLWLIIFLFANYASPSCTSLSSLSNNTHVSHNYQMYATIQQ